MKKYSQLRILFKCQVIIGCLFLSNITTANTAPCNSYICDYTAKEVSWPRIPLQTSPLIPLLFDNFSFKLNNNIKLVGLIKGDLTLKLANGNQITFKKIRKRHYPLLKESKLSTSDIPKFMFEVFKSSLSKKDPLYSDKLVLYKMSRQVDFKRPNQVTLTRKGNLVAYIIKDIEDKFIKSCWVVDLDTPDWFLLIEVNSPSDEAINYLLSNLTIN